MLPFNLTLSVTYRCNSRCKTCNIQQRKAEELLLDEWRRVFAGLRGVFWTTISGGEPFLRQDLPDLVCSLYDQCAPSIINIPTNGLLAGRIEEAVREISLHCRDAQIIINVSIDEIGEKHDEIRGVQGSYEKAVKTFQGLKELSLPNLSVGINTVISRFNVERIPDIYEKLRTLNPDSYVTEIAEERNELRTVGAEIAPGYDEYVRAIDYLVDRLKQDQFNPIGRLTRAFRIGYYSIVKRVLREGRQIIPCYAGFASGQISPDGDVWVCCIKAEGIGNLREAAYDFGKIWTSERIENERSSIRRGTCHCPLANACYTNMLLNPGALWRAGKDYLRFH